MSGEASSGEVSEVKNLRDGCTYYVSTTVHPDKGFFQTAILSADIINAKEVSDIRPVALVRTESGQNARQLHLEGYLIARYGDLGAVAQEDTESWGTPTLVEHWASWLATISPSEEEFLDLTDTAELFFTVGNPAGVKLAAALAALARDTSTRVQPEDIRPALARAAKGLEERIRARRSDDL